MLIQTRTIVVKQGNADKVVERFSQEGLLDEREGLIDITVMVNKRTKEEEEVVVLIRWESEEAWKNWEKSPEHIQGHRDNKGKTPPEYVLSTKVNMYEVKKIRIGKSGR
ncbi:Heme-degrading monooxygenase HmoA [Paenibacillus sp. CECT 9249]|uniref:antibiotic biosynthesis monooxygenase n=1 Tax=Paenibacillus sp. CECT 9249 TaxID=2845385 RepID=UPI001E3CD117|nr:antibiotic biosynthesis monooxygenase [Paenibacillus sp. CECT 9249]CAH0119949.1 Heme-degrading monooxygenase HmoA [Paenibacillus sp. CECT 9249]